jgi:hypothetical protein
MPLIFGLGLVLTTVLLLMPSYTVPKAFNFYDKAQHSLVFVTLALAGLMAFSSRVKAVCFGLCFYGGLMEVCQSLLTTTRQTVVALRQGWLFTWLVAKSIENSL